MTPAAIEPDINLYVAVHGRLPTIDDSPKPWEYRGWLLYYVQLGEHHPEVQAKRWDYYERTIAAGALLDEPIPQIHFEANAAAARSVEKWIEHLNYKLGWSAFSAFVDWLGFGLATAREKPRLDAEMNEWLYRNVNVGTLLIHPADYLGEFLASTKVNKYNSTGFYPTPHNVCEMMTRMIINDVEDSRRAKVCDPCVGSGRMLLHASNRSLCLYGMDVDPLVCAIARINGAMYAPWMAFPLSAEILGQAVPAPAPAELPVPPEHRPPQGAASFRVDDRGQGLLFND